MITRKASQSKTNRRDRVRARLLSRSDLPRLVVKRSNQHFHAQVIDRAGKVVSTASTLNLKDFKGTKTQAAAEVGKLLAEKTAKAKIKAVVLDRGALRFHGRLQAMVEALNQGGVKC